MLLTYMGARWSSRFLSFLGLIRYHVCMVKRFIGIDPGSNCGWAVLDESGAWVASGTWGLTGGRFDGAGMRFVRLDSHVRELLSSGGETVLGFEEVRRHMGTDAAHIYGGIVATVMRVCEELHVPYAGTPVGTVKRQATGRGNAGKDEMVETAEARWGVKVTDDNEADALWIAEVMRLGLA